MFWSFWFVVLEKTLESPLDSKKIKPVNPYGNYPWIFFRRTDAESEAPVHWPSDVMSQPIGKNPNTGKTEGRRTRQDRRWDGWMASPTQWIWVWANFGRQWRTEKTGMLRSTELQRVRHELATEQVPEWPSAFPYFLQFKPEFCKKDLMIQATISSRSCFCWLYGASPSLAAKNIINLI